MDSIYKPGDPAPEGYLAWHKWATAQDEAGLEQVRCGGCNRWCYPQELLREDRCFLCVEEGRR